MELRIRGLATLVGLAVAASASASDVAVNRVHALTLDDEPKYEEGF